MKKIILTLALLAAAGVANAQQRVLATADDSLSYAIGVDIAGSIMGQGHSFDPAIISRAIEDSYAGNALMGPEAAREHLMDYFTNRMPAAKLRETKEFLAGVERQPNVQKTASGLLYEILDPGNGRRVTSDDDRVTVFYTMALADGSVIDSTSDSPATFSPGGLIAAWREGLRLVATGGRIRLWIPPALGYGQSGSGPIGPNAALVSEIDIVGVEPAE